MSKWKCRRLWQTSMMNALLETVYEGDVTYAELATQAVLEQAEVLSEVWAVA